MYINTVHFFSKPWGGGGAENNPVNSSVSDRQCYFYAKYDKNTSTSIGVLRGGAQGGLAPPPLKLIKV